MKQDIDPIDCVGYGTIRTIRAIAKQQLAILAARVKVGDFTAVPAFVDTTHAMLTVIETIEPTAVWGDARTQAMAFIRDYAFWLADIPSRRQSAIDQGMAEVLESLAILNIAITRLGQRLDLE